MHSISTKITAMTVSAIVMAMLVITVLSVVVIKNLGNESSNRILHLLCETGQKNIDSYFESVTQSVETISGYVDDDLKNTDIERLGEHIDRVRGIFEKTANNTAGILTYYYRIDPTVSSTEKGFWYVNLDGNGFVEHEVTDITLYDTEDQSKLVWFTVPKATGKSVWQQPYFTDNLDVYVLSYNVPIYKDGVFIGVIGIEIDYNTLVKQVDNITMYKGGYAFVNTSEGDIIYHPHIDIVNLTAENKPHVPDGLLSDDEYIRYTFEGEEKQAVWLPLSNGMRLNVTVSLSEVNRNWHRLINIIVIVSAVLLIVFIILIMHFSERITKPLRELTYAAGQVDAGNYDVEISYSGDDEVGKLTSTFNTLIGHLKIHIRELNDLAYADALTSVRNKGAFDIYMQELQDSIDGGEGEYKFAVGIFDSNNLKSINDMYGHEKGDMYLKTACALICSVFQHSPVFRIGGDEFAVIIKNDEYRNLSELIKLYEIKTAELNDFVTEPWRKADIAGGFATYDREKDASVNDVVRRADKLMYENKRRKRDIKV